MRINKIKQNPTLLSIINDLTKEEITEILSEPEKLCFPSNFHSYLVDSFINLYKGSLPTGFNGLSERELLFIVRKNKRFLLKLDLISLKDFIVSTSSYQNKCLSSSDVNNVLVNFGLKTFSHELLEQILLSYYNVDIIEEVDNSFILYLVKKKSKLLEINSFISKLKNIPHNALPYVKDYVLLFKIENLDKKILMEKVINSSNLYNLYKNVFSLENSKYYKDKELIEFLEEKLFLNKELLSYGLFNLLTMEHKIKMFQTYPEDNFLKDLNINFSFLSKELISNLINSDKPFDLNLISKMRIETLRFNFMYIRKRILNNEKIGKQSLKYFLVKNKDQLDLDLLEFVIKKYPKFLNSLKVKNSNIKRLSLDIANFDKYTRVLKNNFMDLLTKETLTEDDKNVLSLEIDKVINIKIPININLYSKMLILNYLTKL